jgi:hypothetical protein
MGDLLELALLGSEFYPGPLTLGGCPRIQNKRELSRFKSIINVGV